MKGEPSKPSGTVLSFRHPTLDDGKRMHGLVRDAGVLEPNTGYMYAIMAAHFSETCLLATSDGVVVGAVIGYRPPPSPDTWFVWQIGVHASMRGRGVAGQLLSEGMRRLAERGVRFLAATVDPNNTASDRLFRGFGRRQDASVEIQAFLKPEHFLNTGHAEEHLYRIGPCTTST